MHKGVYEGENAKTQRVKILILGESHHWSAEDWKVNVEEGETESQAKERRKRKAAAYKTSDIVERYLTNYAERSGRDKAYRFFEYISQTFGVDVELNRRDFWSKIYFGNYVEKLCGIRDSQAKNAIAQEAIQYNRSLFHFIREYGVDYVFCFSRRVYHALPQLEECDSENETDGTDDHRLEKRIYNPAVRNNPDIVLDKPVVFYGLRHTSQGFSYRKYQQRVLRILQENDLLF